MHDEEHHLHLPLPDPPELEPILAKLANGHVVRFEARFWQQWRSYEDWAANVWPDPYFAIRVYCTEDTLPKRMVWREEISHLQDFDLSHIADIWEWLRELANSRAIFEFDQFDDLLHHVVEGVGHLSAQEPDATEHYAHLPGLTAPHDFDRVDDSIYTDQ